MHLRLLAAVVGTLFLSGMAQAEVSVVTENFNSTTAGSPPFDGIWHGFTNGGSFVAVVQNDSSNIFAEGSSNKYFDMESTTSSASAFSAASNNLATGVLAGSYSFNFYQPTVSGATGQGFFFRWGLGNSMGNADVAFGVGFKAGGLYAATGAGVNLAATAMATYALDTRHTFAAYYNFNSSGAYSYLREGVVYTLAAGTMDVWLDGTRVGPGLASCGGATPGTPLVQFAFTSKSSFVDKLYVDDLIEKAYSTSAPAAPGSLAASAPGYTVNLSWSAVTGATSYTIARSTTSGGPYTVIGTTTGTSTSDIPLTAATYYYVVSAKNASDTGPYSAQASASIIYASQVQNVVATPGASPGQITVKWSNLSGSPPYTVKRSTTMGGPYTTVGTTAGGGITTLTDSGLSNNTTYFYVVSATNTHGEGPNSLEAAATTPLVAASVSDNFDAYTAGSPPPTGGANKWGSISNTTPFVGLAQTDTSNWFGHGTSSKYLQMAVTSSTASTPLYSATALGTNCVSGAFTCNFYQPTTVGATGDGFLLRIGNGTGSDATTAFGLALKNGNLYTLSGTTLAVNATSTYAYSLGAKHTLAVYFNNSADAIYEYIGANTEQYTVYPGTMDIWIDGGRKVGGMHGCGGLVANDSLTNFNFTAKGSFIGALNVDDIVFNLVPQVAPSAPTGVATTVTGNQVALQWNGVAGAVAYNVLRSSTSGGPYTSISSWTSGNGPSWGYVDTVTPGSYYYVVRAINTSTGSANSTQASASVASPVAAPPAPSGLSATAGTTVSRLSWNPVGGSSYATTYNIKRSVTSGSGYSVIKTGQASPNYTDTGLTTGTAYYYVVTAVNSVGESANSVESACAPTAAPTDGTISWNSDWLADPVMGKWFHQEAVSANRNFGDFSLTTPHDYIPAYLEVRPGDNPISSSGERTETYGMLNSSGTIHYYENSSSGTVYYALSYMVPADWQNCFQAHGAGSWSIALQLHPPDVLACSPTVVLNINSTYNFTVNGGDIDTGGGTGAKSSASAATYQFSDGGGLTPGQWVDLVFRVTYSSTASGSITVWRRNEGQSAFTKVIDQSGIPTLAWRTSQGGTVGDHYWKMGLYRSNFSQAITNVLWEGPFARGTSFKAVEWNAFGTAVGAP